MKNVIIISIIVALFGCKKEFETTYSPRVTEPETLSEEPLFVPDTSFNSLSLFLKIVDSVTTTEEVGLTAQQLAGADNVFLYSEATYMYNATSRRVVLELDREEDHKLTVVDGLAVDQRTCRQIGSGYVTFCGPKRVIEDPNTGAVSVICENTNNKKCAAVPESILTN